MNDAIAKLTGWITELTDFLISLVVLGNRWHIVQRSFRCHRRYR